MTEEAVRVYEFFRQQGFRPVDQGESYHLFKDYTGDNNVLADMNATVAVIWSFCYNALYKVIYGYLCSVWFCNSNPLYGGMMLYFQIQRPRGTPECALGQLVDILYKLSMEGGLPFLQIGTIEDRFLAEYQGIDGYTINAEYSEDHCEYLFRTRDLLELSGGINEDKRRHLNKCSKIPAVSLGPMTKENSRICLEIEEEWCGRQDCPACESFVGCEKKVLTRLVDLFDARIYNGLLLYHAEKPVGYAIWEKVSEKIAFLYLGKSNIRDYFVYLIYNMVKLHLSGVEYLNMGEDMGKMGLRIFKRHLGIYDLRRKYLCTFIKTGGSSGDGSAN